MNRYEYSPEFLLYFERLIGHEGGYTADPKDPGNWTSGRVGVGILKGTKFGIAANTYGQLDIRNLTLDDAKAIYWEDWWLKIGADVLPTALSYQMWQFAVNAGMGNARRCLQRAAGVVDDGLVGPLTIAAVRRMDVNDLLMRYNSFVIDHYTSLSTWTTYGRGWARRVAENLRYAAIDNPTVPVQ